MIKKLISKFTKERDFTSIPITKAIWLLAIPIIISNMLQAMFNLIDMAWVGRLGAEALAAVSMSGSILMILMFIMIGVGIGTTAMVSRFVGAKKYSEANTTAMQSLLMGLIGSLVFALAGYFLSPWFLRILGAEPAVIALGTGYLQITFIGVIVMFYMFLISAILQGAGDTVTPMLILAVSVFINIILDPLMIFGVGFFPRMGVNGAALATVIAEGIGSAIALEVLLKGRSKVHVRLDHFKVDFDRMWRILKIGIPASIQMSLRGLMGLVLMAIVAGFGTYAIAAYGVGLRLSMLAMMPGFAFGGAAATLVGQNLGAEKPERAVASAWSTVGYYSIFMLSLSVLFFIWAPRFMMVFNNQPEVISMGADFLRFIAAGNLFVAVGLILGRSISGSGDTTPVAVFTFIALWLIQMPLAFFLSRLPVLGVRGIWIATLVAQVVLAGLTTFWFQLGRWKHKKV
ncbi:MAG: MATE family efflux transporter [Candidatus Margulisbacteria bacterium]|nr:MATE family efflux transporter [Candidatus Margulisiibacteriota bacterium]